MKTESNGDTLLVTEFDNLSATQAGLLRDLVQSSLLPEHRHVDVEMGSARFVDSEGLSALISIHKSLAVRGGSVRLLNAGPMVRDLFKLTRLEGLFEFVSAN